MKFFTISLLLGLLAAGFVLATVLPPELSRSLFVGLKGDDVKQLQEYLAQDKALYPEGLTTGYFGRLTEAAVKRFQAKHGIETVGIVGPKTRAKLNNLRLTAQPAPPTPIPESTSTPPAPEQPAPTPEPTAKGPMIKTGTGVAEPNRNFTVGPATFSYIGVLARNNRALLSPVEPPAFLANLRLRAEFSSCENIEAKSYTGIKNICDFTNANTYTFTEHKDPIRIYDKKALITANTYQGSVVRSCYEGILLFKKDNIYGAIDPDSINSDGNFNYRYWYDESGGSDFSSLCSSTSTKQKELARLLELLREAILKLRDKVGQ